MPFVSTMRRRLACEPILQPDLLFWRVQGAVAGASNLQLREARGRASVQLQPGLPVVAVFLITGPVVEAEAELVTLSTLVRHCVSSA